MKVFVKVLEKNPIFGIKLWEMFNQEAGKTHKNQAAFIDKNIALVSDLVKAEKANKLNAQNNKSAGVEKPAFTVTAGQVSGDPEWVSEHDPG